MEEFRSEMISSMNSQHLKHHTPVYNNLKKGNKQNSTEYDRKLNELLEWQKEQEEQVKIAEQFTLKLKKELEKADINEFQYRSVDELVTTDYLNDELKAGDSNESNKSKSNEEFNERLLSDIVEESFEQGLANDSTSKFSTPKETSLNHDLNETGPKDENEQVTTTYNSLNKQYTKHCTEECTKQNCAHTIRFSESYERILKIISNYNAKLKNGSAAINESDAEEENEDEVNSGDDDGLEDEEEVDEESQSIEESHHVDFKDELKQMFSSTNQNIYALNEYFREELTKSLDPTLNNEQYTYRSLSETNLNRSLDRPTGDSRSINRDEMLANRLRNRTFSSDAINNQLRSIEKDLGIENIENTPIKPGVDGQQVKTFDELLNQQLNDYGKLSSIFNTPENPTKKPFLRKGAGLKRFQSRSTSEPRGKLCRIRNQKLKQNKHEDKKSHKKRIDINRKLPDPKRIDYLAQPKFTINRDFGSELNDENNLGKSNQKCETINKDFMTSNLSDRFKDENVDKHSKVKNKITKIPITRPRNDKVNDHRVEIQSQKEYMSTENEQAKKKPRVQLVSKISINKSYEEKVANNNDLVQKEWDKKESVEDSNRKLEALLEKFIELYERKNNTKADDETRKNLINMLKNSLRMENNWNEPITCKECGKSLDEDSESDSFCCNPIEADRSSSKFSNDLDTFIDTPKIGMQTIALRNKIETLQKRLTNLQSRCDQDERILDKTNCQSFANKDEKGCTCSGQMEMLKEKLNFITNKLQSIEKNTLLHGSTNLNSPGGKVINHRIIVDEPDDEKTRKRKVSKHIDKVKTVRETDKKLPLKNRKTEIERKLVEPRSSNNDAVVQKITEGDSKIVKYQSGLKVVEKSDGTVQKICSNGYQEIFFSDDTIMRVLVDGTKIIDFPNGEREIRTSNYKRHEFVDGSIRTTYSDGTKETRYLDGKLRVKDKYGNVLVDSRLPSTLH